MKENCYCGRTGDVEDREPVLGAEGKRALRCPGCGSLDDLAWLSEEAGLILWREARSRQRVLPGRIPAA